jgi:hypothetical protein
VLENGRVTLNMDKAVLSDIMDRAISAAVAESQTRLIINRDRAAEDISLWTDADRLAQVFINLISNAQKYCDAETPELTISVARTGQGVAVDFCDNGSGIPPRQEALIFEKFSRLDTARGAPGAGLGLAISLEVMSRLDGRLRFLPGPGGARFRVELPSAALQAA